MAKLICKHCGHEMTLTGTPVYVEWFCEKCFEKTDNYGVNLREQEYVIRTVEEEWERDQAISKHWQQRIKNCFEGVKADEIWVDKLSRKERKILKKLG